MPASAAFVAIAFARCLRELAKGDDTAASSATFRLVAHCSTGDLGNAGVRAACHLHRVLLSLGDRTDNENGGLTADCVRSGRPFRMLREKLLPHRPRTLTRAFGSTRYPRGGARLPSRLDTENR